MRSTDTWVFLFLVGLVVFNWPFLTIFADSLPYALFILWALYIAVTALFAGKGGRDRNP